MEGIFILGNKETTAWANGIGELITIPSMTVNDSSVIHDFVCRTFASVSANDKIVIDLDSTDPALALTIAMHIRLSIMDIRQGALSPILLISYLSLQSFLSLGECSQLFLTSKGVSLCSPDELKSVIGAISGITASEYKSVFLDKIQIHPDASIGRHSMANQWGADVLYRLVCKEDPKETEGIAQAKKKLYYKYTYLNTIDLNALFSETSDTANRHDSILLGAIGKSILLIDDEADRGWGDVLHKWMLNCKTFDIVNDPISNYEDIWGDIRQKIESDYYDLYLLDLRLLGNNEDYIYDTDAFSGMKVLKKIKDINRGNQVIIMTASNKAWNMKALLDAGADGYYIKESPELRLPISFSEANFKSFKTCVETALNRNGFKRQLYLNVKTLAHDILSSTRIDGNLANELSSVLRSSLHQALVAKSANDFAYSYLSLFQTFELLARDYITEDGENGWLIHGVYDLVYYDTNRAIIPQQRIVPQDTKHPSIKSKILGIYVEVGNGRDIRFASKDLPLTIERRNAFVHNEQGKLCQAEIAKIYNENGFIHLLNTVKNLLSTLL